MATIQDYKDYAVQQANVNGIDPNIFQRQIQEESNWNPNAYNPISGASGICQIVPQYHPGIDPWDPFASIAYAASLDRSYLDTYDNNWCLALAAYNAGSGNVADYGGVPPFPETQRYLNDILGAGNCPSNSPSNTGIASESAGGFVAFVLIAGFLLLRK